MTNSLKQTLANCAHKAFSVFMAIALIMSMVVVGNIASEDAAAAWNPGGSPWTNHKNLNNSPTALSDDKRLMLGQSNLDYTNNNSTQLVTIGASGGTGVRKAILVKMNNYQSSETIEGTLCTLKFTNAGAIGGRSVDVTVTLSDAELGPFNYGKNGGSPTSENASGWRPIAFVNQWNNLWIGNGKAGDLGNYDFKGTINVDTTITITWSGTNDQINLPYFYKFMDIDAGSIDSDYLEAVSLKNGFTDKSQFFAYSDTHLYDSGWTFYTRDRDDGVQNNDTASFRYGGFYALASGESKIRWHEGRCATVMQIFSAYTNIPTPTKSVDKSTARPSETVNYTVSQTMNTFTVDTMTTYTSWTMTDKIPEGLTYKSATVKYNGSTLGNDAGSLSYDSNSRTVKWTFNSSWLNNESNYTGGTVTMDIQTTADKITDKSNKVVSNSAKSTISGIDYTTNTVTTTIYPTKLNLYKYYKTASTGDTKNSLEGAKFAIYEGDSWSTAQNNKVGEGTTDDNGNLEFGGIINPNSTYWLFETEAPEKFEKVDPIALKTGSNPNTATVYSLTWKAGVASTSKYKNADNPLTFASATNGAEPTSGTGNMSRGLNVVKVNGNYYSFNFTDYYCDEAALVVTNGVPSSVKIANYDYIQSFDQAASYKLTAVSKEEVENSITPAQDAGYYPDKSQGTIQADSNYTMTVEVEDKMKGQPDLEIWKYRLNGSEKNNLRDAQFSLYKGNTWSAAKNNEVASGTTDEDGMLGFPAVFDKNSTYWLVETKAPNGYLEIDPIVIKIGDSYDTADIYASEYVSSDNYNIGEQTDVWNLITSNGNNEYDVEIEDPPGSVNANIYKYALSEEGRKLPLPEASFTIYEGDDWMVAQDNEVFSGETDGNGEIGADGIIKPNKTYWIIETEAPKDYKVAEPIVLKTSRDLKTAETYAINQTDEGYEIGDKKSDLAVSDEGGFDLDIVDELAPTIGLHKYTSDSDGNKTSLEGAKFAIYRGSKWEDAQEDKVAEATTDANGNIDFNFGVVNNDTYWVVETEAPDGYYIAMPYVLVISDDYNSATYYTTSSTEDGYEIADELGTVDSKDNKFVLEIDDDGIPHMPSAGVTPWQGGTAAAVLVMAAAAVELVRRRIATRTDK